MTSKSEIKIKEFKLVYVIGFGLLPLEKRPPMDLRYLIRFLGDLKNGSKSTNGMEKLLRVEDYWTPDTNNTTYKDKTAHESYDYFNHLIKLDTAYFTPALRKKGRYIRIKFRPVEVNVDNDEDRSQSKPFQDKVTNTVKITPLLFLHAYGISVLTLFVDFKLNEGEVFLEDLINFAVNLLRKSSIKIKVIQEEREDEERKNVVDLFLQSVRGMFKEVVEKSSETDKFVTKIFNEDEGEYKDKGKLKIYRGDIPVPLIILSLWDYSCSCPNFNYSCTKEKECPLIKKYAHLTMVKRTTRVALIPSHEVLRDSCLEDYLGKDVSFVNGVRCFVHWGGALHLVDNNNYTKGQILEQLLTIVWLEELTLFTGYLLITYNDCFWKIWSRIRRSPKISRRIDPGDLANLRDDLLGALEEFHGISLTRDYLVKNTLHYLKTHLGIYRDYNSLVWKVNTLSSIIETKHDEDLKKRELLLTCLVGALGLFELGSMIYNITQNAVITFVLLILSTVILYIIINMLFKLPK